MGDRVQQLTISGRLLDHAVKEVVRALPVALDRPVAVDAAPPVLDHLLDRVAEQSLGLAKLIELSVVDVRDGLLRGESLELGAHRVRLADVARARALDDRTAVRLDDHEAARLQLTKCFTNRGPAHAELRCERLLAEARPGRDLTAQYAGLDRRGQAVDEPVVIVRDG